MPVTAHRQIVQRLGHRRESRRTRYSQSASPAVIGNVAYVHGARGAVRAIDAGSGEDIWKLQLPGEFGDEPHPASTAVADGVVIVVAGRLFGIDAEHIPDVLRSIGKLDLDFQGFQIFSGSQNLDAAALNETQRETIELAIALSQQAPSKVQILNIGGGLGIPYFPGEQALDLDALGTGLAKLMPDLRSALPDARIIVELGRYIVGEAGIYVCRVVDRKVSRDKTYLITDGGLHHHLAASGNFGQVIRRNFPVLVGNRLTETPEEVVNVVGCLCTPIDVLAREIRLPRCQIGDLIVILQSGAYGATGSPVNFLSHPAPIEVLV